MGKTGPKPDQTIIGRNFGYLTVIGVLGKGVVTCKCACGTLHTVQRSALIGGRTNSCGCASKKLQSLKRTKHGCVDSKEYRAWVALKQRCSNPLNPGYVNYGGRGITICPRWETSFEAFLEDMGLAPTEQHSLDRINVNGNYEPLNCRWATSIVQAYNRRNTTYLTWQGETKPAKQWASLLGINYATIRSRMRLGWSIDRILTK